MYDCTYLDLPPTQVSSHHPVKTQVLGCAREMVAPRSLVTIIVIMAQQQTMATRMPRPRVTKSGMSNRGRELQRNFFSYETDPDSYSDELDSDSYSYSYS